MADPSMKPITWLGRSKKVIQGFPVQTRRDAGYQLYRVQQGLVPSDWKPMPSLGSGAMEIRLHRPHEHRIIYVAKFDEAVYVLHAFEKKTQKTPKQELANAEKVYRELLSRRSSK
jgi:phage-related protein